MEKRVPIMVKQAGAPGCVQCVSICVCVCGVSTRVICIIYKGKGCSIYEGMWLLLSGRSWVKEGPLDCIIYEGMWLLLSLALLGLRRAVG